MYTTAYIDCLDLLILSYYDRFLCLDRSNNYIITNGQKCKKLRKLINHLKNDPNVKKNALLLVKIDQTSMNLLRQWGHGLDKNQKQISLHKIPYFAKSMSMNGGSGNVEVVQPIQQIQPSLEYKRDSTFSSQLKDTLKMILTVMKIAVGVGSVVVTFGAGGDTIVESISSTINSGMFYVNLAEVTVKLATDSPYLAQLFKISFVEGPEQVKIDTIVIIKQIFIDGQDDQIGIICGLLQNLLDSIARVVGDWISTFIPDDAGIVGTIVTTIINASSKHAFNMLSTLFNKVPTKFQDLLKHPEELHKFLIGILRSLEEGLRRTDSIEPSSNEMSLSATVGRIKKVGQQIIPGANLAVKYGIDSKVLDMLFNVIKNYFEPNIERAILVVGQVMPLIFAILTFSELCHDTAQLSALKAEISMLTIPRDHDLEIPPSLIRQQERSYLYSPQPRSYPIPSQPRSYQMMPQPRSYQIPFQPRPYQILPQTRSYQMPFFRSQSIQQGGCISQPYREPTHDQINYNLAKYLIYLKNLTF